MDDEPPTREDLLAVAAHLPALLRVQANPAEEHGGERNHLGDMQMPYLDYAPEVSQLQRAIHRHRIVLPFDWGAWQEQAKLLLEPNRVAVASLDEVRRLITLHIRKERFCEGHLEAVIKSGHMAALLQRLGELAATHG